MGVSKVIYGGKTLVDLTGDTVASEKMLSGTKAHGANGELIVGTLTPVTVHSGSAAPTGNIGNEGDIYLVTE